MLDRRVVEAVEQGRFYIWTAAHVSDGIALLTGQAPGMEAGVATGEEGSVGGPCRAATAGISPRLPAAVGTRASGPGRARSTPRAEPGDDDDAP